MMIHLENESITASFSTKGAELQSLKSNKTNREYLWSGDPAYWGKFSPVLFPIVGALKNSAYYYQGTEYQLSRHGFARDQEFSVQQISETELLFSLVENEETLKNYPFRFRLNLRYQLHGSSLSCMYEVANPADTPLLFSIGAHPAFATPCNEMMKYEDYLLEFNKETTVVYHKIKGDLIDNETVEMKLAGNALQLKHKLFYDDALVFKSLKSDSITLRNTKTKEGLRFQFPGFPYFGIWAAKEADFICLEPWCGIADGVDHNQDLNEKEGIISLGAQETWQREWTVELIMDSPGDD